MLAELCGGGYDRLRPNERPGWLLPFAPDMMTGTRERGRRRGGGGGREGGLERATERKDGDGHKHTQSRSIEKRLRIQGRGPSPNRSVGGRVPSKGGGCA